MPTLPASLPWRFGGYIPPDDLFTIEGTDLAWVESHCEQGKKLFLAQFRDKPRLEAALCALLRGVEDVHDAAYQLATERLLDTAVGVQLDVLGGVLGLPRAGWTDEMYRTLLRAQILVNRSSGTADELLRILALLAPAAAPEVELQYPAAVVLRTGAALEDEVEARTFFGFLARAVAGGIRLLFEFSLTPSAETFRFTNVAGTVAAAGFDEGAFAGAEE